MEIKLFTPYKKQREFIERFADTDDLFGVCVAPRGSGKTLLAINLILYWLLSKPNQKGGWVAPTFAQSKSVLDTIVSTSGPVIESSNRMEATITFVNGSTIKFLSSDSADNIRGFRFNHLIIDEAAFVKETVLGTAILPTLNPNGKKCLLISTPKGKNHFYNWYMKEDVVSMRFPLTECPYVKQELIDEARNTLPPDLFKQEFEGAFIDSSNDVFVGVERVSNVNVFSKERKVDAYVGIDTGLSSDMSVITCISPMGRVLWMEGINNENINSIAQKFINIMNDYNIVGGYIETNGIGRAMFDLVAPKFRRVKEFHTSQDSKMDMVRKLLHDIETLSVELPSEELCPELHREFADYTYKMGANGKISFTHAPGRNDDYIDALLLANYSRSQFMERRPMNIKSTTKGVRPVFGGLPT